MSQYLDFWFSGQRGAKRKVKPELIEAMLNAADPLEAAELTAQIEAHQKFLASGGAGGSWAQMSAAGLPLCLYVGARGGEGAQLVLRLKRLPDGLSLRRKDLRYADLSGCMAAGVNFSEAKLDWSIATDSIFRGAKFTSAKLQLVRFAGAQMQGCDFRNADLRGADFERADCTGGDFRGADLGGARFPGTVLKDVKR